MFGLYNCIGASDYCGGVQSGQPDNAQFTCYPALDAATSAAATAPDVATFTTATVNAFNAFGQAAIDIPVFTAAIRIAALRSADGIVNALGFSYTNAATMQFAHKGTYTPSNSAYAFGGGDPNTLRWGQASGTSQLNVFNVQTVWEFNVLGEVYDTLFSLNPVAPGQVFCWMCESFSTSVDGSGNQHFLVELRQNLRWQDGAVIDAKDVKFSLLNLRDFSANAGGALFNLLGVTVLSNTTLDISFIGQSISYPVDLAAFIIPRHIWELSGNTFYGDVGIVDPAKSDSSYDPVQQGTFIGSGQFACVSVFASDLGKVGTGCIKNSDGSRGGQAIGASGTMLLQAFDFTANPGNTDPFLQYMRSYNSAWGTGSGTAAQSGQFQEWSYADQNNDGVVTVSDLASVAACFGASAPGGSCSSLAYSYWLRSAFHTGSPSTIGSEVTIVASHLDDTYTSPFSWPSGGLTNLTPFTP